MEGDAREWLEEQRAKNSLLRIDGNQDADTDTIYTAISHFSQPQ